MKHSIAILSMIAFFTSVSAKAAASEDPCPQAAQKLAKALNYAAFENFAANEEISYEGASDVVTYEVTVNSKPITFGDGHTGPQSATYIVTLSNDSASMCMVESIVSK